MSQNARLHRGAAAAIILLCLSAACQKPADGAAPAQSAAAAAPAARAPGGATPEAVFERARKAAADKNFPELVACLVPEKRHKVAQDIHLMATLIVAFDKKRLDESAAKAKAAAKAGLSDFILAYSATMKKYGLPDMTEDRDPDQAAQNMARKKFADMDHAAFIADMISALEKYKAFTKDDDNNELFAVLAKLAPPGGTLENVMIDGDGAMATAGGEPGACVRVEVPKLAPLDGTLENVMIDGDGATATAGGEPVAFVRVDGRWYVVAEGADTASAHGTAPEAKQLPIAPPASVGAHGASGYIEFETGRLELNYAYLITGTFHGEHRRIIFLSPVDIAAEIEGCHWITSCDSPFWLQRNGGGMHVTLSDTDESLRRGVIRYSYWFNDANGGGNAWPPSGADWAKIDRLEDDRIVGSIGDERSDFNPEFSARFDAKLVKRFPDHLE